MGHRSKMLGEAQDLGDGRFGVLVEMEGSTFYVEHAVTGEGLVAQVWDETRDELVIERRMDWAEVIERMMSVWKPEAPTTSVNGTSPSA